MVKSRFSVNFAFASVVCVLALTAATAFYANSGRPAVKPAPTEQASGSALPENHPDIDVSKKLAAFNEMAAREPKNPEYQTQIANIYYDLGQYEKAAQYYQRSLTLRPGDPNVETDLAVCLHYTGQNDKALETLDRVLSYSPNFSQALYNKGVILIGAKNDIQGGIGVWEELLRTNPDFAQKAELQQKISKLKESLR